MRKFAFIFLILLASCSEDRMDIPEPIQKYDVEVTKIVDEYRVLYTDATKTTILQETRIPEGSFRRVIREERSVTWQVKQDIVDQYDGVLDITFSFQGTTTNTRTETRYSVKVWAL